MLAPAETEAAEIAARIQRLVTKEYMVRGEDGARPCTWEDIAILFRSGGKQHLFEKHLRENGIPCQSENLRGLFSDAPINDMYALLRLAVRPEDNTAYAMLLRSPFVYLSDDGFALAMLQRTPQNGVQGEAENKSENSRIPSPFQAEMEILLNANDTESFQRGRQLWESVRDAADRIPIAELVTKLWYETGYRYELLSDPGLHRYEELYDYFFELARQSDVRGEPLALFLDRIQGLMTTGERIDDLDIPVERSGGVRLMTVHKSKGLEFPIVFLVDAGNEGRANHNDSPVFFSSDTGLSVNTGAAEKAEQASSNYFYEKGRKDEQNLNQAEIRRLLYVGMTRAETRLCISGTVSLGGAPEEAARSPAELREAINAYLDKKDEAAAKQNKIVYRRSFFDLLSPSFTTDDIPGVTLTEILPLNRTAGRYSSETVSAQKRQLLADLYMHTAIASYEPSPPHRFNASELQVLYQNELSVQGQTSTTEQNLQLELLPQESLPEKNEPDALDRLLRQNAVSATDFGTLVHRVIEGRFTGTPVFIPSELRKMAEMFADRFMQSDLGRRATTALWRETEYGFITRYHPRVLNREITVSGQMDLVFGDGERVCVVDYKTDKEENPEIHREQLSVYAKAASDIFDKPVETWLFYLRNGTCYQVFREYSDTYK